MRELFYGVLVLALLEVVFGIKVSDAIKDATAGSGLQAPSQYLGEPMLKMPDTPPGVPLDTEAKTDTEADIEAE